MTSLLIYILSFTIIIGIVGSITVFFNNQTKEINKNASVSSEYNKFNLYMLDQTKGGYTISKMSEEGASVPYVTLSKGSEANTFVLLGNILYFNKIKLCEQVQEFKVKKELAENGKDVLKTYININGTVYTTDYVIE